MMSSKGVIDMQKERMRKEAQKQRAETAKAANILIKSEHKIKDFGFVSRKVTPDADDAFSHSLKNGLIDYREILGTKDSQYLGVDNNVPGTPEFDIVSFEDTYRKSHHHHNQSNHNKHNQHLINGFKSGHESVLLQNNNQNNKESSITQKNATKKLHGRAEHQSKLEIQQKPKPTTLSMPSLRPTPTAIDKTPKTHPSKIESILKEMTDTTPPLTDIQTPVKTQDTRFPFPHLPPAKDNTTVAAVRGKTSCPFKTEETLKNDLITTSDDDTDDEGSNEGKLQHIPNTRAGNLSASSSSSEESSSESSGSESSESENETRHSGVIGKKAMKKPVISKQPISNMVDDCSPNSKNLSVSTPSCQKSLRGKVIKEDMCEKQVSPLNSVPKEKKKEQELSPINESFDMNSRRISSIQNGITNHLDVDSHAVFSGDYFDSTHLEPFFDELGTLFDNANPNDITNHNDSLDNIPMMDLEQMPSSFHSNLNSDHINYSKESTNFIQMAGNTTVGNCKKQTMLYDGEYVQDDLHGLTKESFNEHNAHLSDVVDDMVNDRNSHGKEPRNHMIVDVSAFSRSSSTPYILDDKYTRKMPSKGSKFCDRSQDKIRKKDMPNTLDNMKKSGNSQSQTKITPSKKDNENDWFKRILSPGKKQYDLPYVNPEKLKFVGAKEPRNSAQSKVAKAESLKIQIPLEKLGRLHVNSKISDRNVTLKGVKSAERTAHMASKTTKNDRNESIKKIRKKPDSKAACKGDNPSRPQCGGKDIETIKSLMAELSNKGTSDDDEVIDVVTTSPLKRTKKPEFTVSGKGIRGCPISNSKTDLNSTSSPDIAMKGQFKSKNIENSQSQIKTDTVCSHNRKRTRSIEMMNVEEENDDRGNDEAISPYQIKSSDHQMKSLSNQDDKSIQDMDIDDDDDDDDDGENNDASSRLTDNAPQLSAFSNRLFIKIPLSRLRRHPGDETSSENKDRIKQVETMKQEIVQTENGSKEPVWKPPPKMKIPRIPKNTSPNITTESQAKNCLNGQQDCTEQDVNDTRNFKAAKEKKIKRITEGRGVKRKDRDRNIKHANQNPNVCCMCGTLQKDTGRDPIRLGTYKTSYMEFLSMGTRNKRIADCHDPSDRGPKYIDAVLKFIQYLVGLEITGKTTTKKGADEFMYFTSQCIDLVGHVINQYGKKENNNIIKFDDRFLFLCLRLQSVLYFKLFGIKKDSTSRCSKLLSEYFKIRRSPHRVSMKGSTGTPSPMSPSSSHNGSVASFGSAKSSASSGSYDKLSSGNMVSIPAETFERMQQYTAYTRFWLHGQRLWDEAEALAQKCQEFIRIVSHQVGALTHDSSMLHLVDYVSAGLEIIKEDQS